jgi:hypothetical protein
MPDVRIRRQCSKPALVPDGRRIVCPECQAKTYGAAETIQHRLVIEWMPIEQAIAPTFWAENRTAGVR